MGSQAPLSWALHFLGRRQIGKQIFTGHALFKVSSMKMKRLSPFTPTEDIRRCGSQRRRHLRWTLRDK